MIPLAHKNPLLRKPTEKFDFVNCQMNPGELVDLLTEELVKGKGIGLAAPQIGLPYSVFVAGHHTDLDSVIEVFNPIVVDTSDEYNTADEGCLSFPGLYLPVERYDWIRVRFSNRLGETNTVKVSGLTARIFQHEIEHLQGTLFTTKVSQYHLEKGLREQKRLNRGKK